MEVSARGASLGGAGLRTNPSSNTSQFSPFPQTQTLTAPQSSRSKLSTGSGARSAAASSTLHPPMPSPLSPLHSPPPFGTPSQRPASLSPSLQRHLRHRASSSPSPSACSSSTPLTSPSPPPTPSVSAGARAQAARQAVPSASAGPGQGTTSPAVEEGSARPAVPSRFKQAQGNGGAGEGGAAPREVDVVLLGNLCVDVLVDVDELPPSGRDQKWAYLQHIKKQPTDESKWEAGGCLNFGIAAARLGLRCSAYGYMGPDQFGAFLGRVLEEEGLGLSQLREEDVGGALGGPEDGYTGETWVCWVLIDPKGKHSFASPFDFNKFASFTRVRSLPDKAARLIGGAQSLAVNGFAFDEFRPEVVEAAARRAQAAGGAVFFDPGPRTRSLSAPGAAAQASFDWLARESEVLLLTSDEAEVLTGCQDPVTSAQMLLESGGPRRQWVVVKRGAEGCVLASASEGLFAIPGFKVEVADTVGCGDSFAAAIALGYIRGEAPATTLALANAVGAATATRSGAGRNVAEAARVAEILLGLQAREEGWHDGNVEDWDAEVWLEDQGRRFRVGHVGVHGAATCPSGTPLVESVREAARLLHHSLSRSRARRQISQV